VDISDPVNDSPGPATCRAAPGAVGCALDRRSRVLIIGAALLSLFLGALDSLVMSAAMPTVVAELGGLDLFSWVYSAYLLARTVALPIFGKLADIYRTKTLYAVAILLFSVASFAAGFSHSMGFLILCRVAQGIGAGGNFALVYIVLADISLPAERGKTLSLGSFVWGLASVLGPTLGGFIVGYFSWRWIFFVNVPLGILSLVGVALYLVETRPKKAEAAIDYAGAAALSAAVLSVLFVFLLGGQTYPWGSPVIFTLCAASAAFGGLFYWFERRAREPILPLAFFGRRGFSAGNAAVFMGSFAIFAFFGFAPLFIQGALGQSPMQVGSTVLSLSLGWSIGSLVLGRLVHRWGSKASASAGAAIMAAGCGLTLTFRATTSLSTCFWVFSLVGVGMGFVVLATLLVVQESVPPSDLGVATASNQFARNLGATVGVGVCGSLFTTRFSEAVAAVLAGSIAKRLSPNLASQIHQHADNIFRPEVQAQLEPTVLAQLQAAVGQGVIPVFVAATAAAVVCFFLCLALPRDRRPR
jgi:EmrB/QacA subfamily drug resistance transporter